MPGELYDAAVEALDEPQDKPAPSADPLYSEAAAALDGMDGRRETSLRKSFIDSASTTPDRAAETRRLSLKFGVPASVIDRNIDDYREKSNLERPFGAISKQTPHTAAWLEQPANAAIAKDDLEQLGALEWLVTAPQRAFQQGVDQVRFAQLKTESLFRELSQEERDLLGSYKYNMENGGELGSRDSWFRKAVVGGAQLLPNIAGGLLMGAKYGTAGAVEVGAVGAAAGSIIPGAGTLAGGTTGATTGFSAGMLYGGAKFGFQLEAGLAYDEYSQFKDETGRPIDPRVAKIAAVATGAINAGLESFQVAKLMDAIPGLDTLKGALTRGAVRKALAVPTVRAALLHAVKEYGTTLAEESLTEVAQRAVTIMSGELAKTASGQDIPHRTADDIFKDLVSEGVGAVTGFGLTVLPGPALHVAMRRREAQVAQHNAAFFTALGEGAASSKTLERSPAAVRELLERATADGPIAHVYAPLETWRTYWQEQQIDPREMAAAVTGDPDAYDRAEETGADLKIPTARYATTIAPSQHNAFFANELRFSPEEMNAREAQTYLEAERAHAEAGQAQIAAAEQGSAREQIRGQLQEQLEAAGVQPETAQQYARLVEAGVGTMAESAGLDPLEVYARYGLEVQRPALQSSAAGETAARTEAQVQEAPIVGAAPTTEDADAAGRPLFDQPDRRQTAGQGPGGVERRGVEGKKAVETSGRDAAFVEGALDVSNPVEAALAMMRENPNVVRDAEAMRRRAVENRPPSRPRGGKYAAAVATSTGTDADARILEKEAARPARVEGVRSAGAAAASETGEHVPDAGGELARVDEGGTPEGRGDGASAERGGVSPADVGGIFQRQPADTNRQRLTPDVTRELERIRDEMETFPFVGRTWTWLEGPKTGNAAGGAANISGGAAGAKVYDDILYLAPVNTIAGGAKKGQPARGVYGTRTQVLNAIRATLDKQDIATNLAEGAVRVAERRAAGEWKDLNPAELPPSWGTVAPVELTDRLSEAIDDALDTGGDTSFDVSAFGEALFGAGEQLQEQPSDVLDTGEVQPRLPEAGAVREQEIATPAFEAPFALESEVAAPATREKQTELFQETLTPEALDAWADQVRHEEGLEAFDVRLQNRYTGDLVLESIAAPKGSSGQGAGSRAMRRLIEFADQHHKRIVLSIAEKGHQPTPGAAVTSSPDRLRAFYKRFGFVNNRGRFKDYSLSIYTSMYRDPKPTSTTLEQARRGSIVIGPDRKMKINLFAEADLSTFLHETGHFFLEVMGDLADQVGQFDPNMLSPTQRQLLADYGATLQRLGVESRGELDRPHHEQFAREFEAYLFEGNAPSLELRGAFARFRAWLVGVYRQLRNLNAALTPEVRHVFDRMLASDQAIREAEAAGNLEPMFTTPESAGMTPERFDLYRQTVADASRVAREQLDAKLLVDVHRAQTAAYKTRRAEIREAVNAEVRGRREYRALEAMQRGGEKLDRAVLVARYGEDRLKTLPRPYVYTREGGLDPDTVAERYGFSSGDEMLTACANLPPLRVAIEGETDRRLQAEQPTLLNGQIVQAAQAASANNQRDAVIRAELRALWDLQQTVKPFEAQARREERAERDYERRWLEAETKLRIAYAEGRVTAAKQREIDRLEEQVQELRAKARGGAVVIRNALPRAETLRTMARERIARTRIRDLSPAAYWSASRKAAAQAVEHAARQDFDAAIQAKTQELVNVALYREAERVREDVDGRIAQARALGKPATRAKLGYAGEAYLDQVDGILDRYEFAKVSPKVLERRAGILNFVAGLEGQGLPVDLPEEVLNDARRINYQQLTVEELVGVTDGLEQILHLARLKNRLLKNAEKRELDAVAGGIAQSVRDNKVSDARKPARDRRPSEARRRMVDGFFASHRKLSSLVREIDGFKDGGALWEAIVRPLNEAGAREAEMNAAASTALHGIFDTAYPKAEKSRLYDKRHVPAVGQSLSKMEVLSIALNQGNEGNRQRVLAGERWTQDQVDAVVGTLDERDWRFVQSVWDYLDSFWPEIEAKQKRVNGIAPARVEATPVRTPFGELRGGYFPLKYDDRLHAGALQNLDLEAANLARGAAYAQATTKRGHTKERVSNVRMPLRRDFGVLFEHVGQVIHDLSHHETLIDVGRVLGHRDVQAAILEKHGDQVYREIKETIRDVAFGDVPARNDFERALNYLRVGKTVAGLGWRMSTALLQPFQVTQAMVRIGPKWVARGMSRWLRNITTMQETVGWIEERSAFMASRARTQQREINEIRNAVGVETGRLTGWIDKQLARTTFDTVTRQGIADSYFYLIQRMQQIADIPTWLGAYEKAMDAGEKEERAIALADQAVLDSQGGGQAKDLARVQRGGPMMKIWTNFYSFFNTTYNLAVEAKRSRNLKNPIEVGRLAVDYMLLFTIPATLGYAIRQSLKPGDDDKDVWTALAKENASYLLGLMVGVRELVPVVTGFDYEGPAGAGAFAEVGKLAKQVGQGQADRAFWRSLAETTGILFHYPAGQLRQTVEGILALAEGKTSNPGVLITGAPKEKKGRRR